MTECKFRIVFASGGGHGSGMPWCKVIWGFKAFCDALAS